MMENRQENQRFLKCRKGGQDVTKERIQKELSKVRKQLAELQARQKDLEGQLQMAEDAEK